MNNHRFVKPFQLVVVLFRSKNNSTSKKRNIFFFNRRSVFETAYDSIAKGTNNTTNSTSGVIENSFLSHI
jgi:hypothetical protein